MKGPVSEDWTFLGATDYDMLAPELEERVMEVAKPVPAPDTYKYQSRVGSDVG